MDPLEGTTLDLIYRRRVSTFYPGYTMILITLGMIVALPLVKVDVVSTSGGMIRPFQEPVELFSSITGIVDSTLLLDHRKVKTGDTLVWIRRNIPETRMDELTNQIERNRLFISDIRNILQGRSPSANSRYRQSFRNHSASGKHLRLQKTFLEDEYKTAESLYNQQVIPMHDFEQAKSEYLVTCAQLENHIESYKSRLEDECSHLLLENMKIQGELDEIRASIQNYAIVAPARGILNQCRGVKSGSVIQPGTCLGTISMEGELVADCFVETRDIKEIKTGMQVRLRLDGKSNRPGNRLETEVSRIDPDVMLLNGRPVYRVRCRIKVSSIADQEEMSEALVPGMTFRASMLLYRASIASLLTEKLNSRFNPAKAQLQTPQP